MNNREMTAGRVRTKNMVRVAVLAAIALILMQIKTPIPFIAPAFMSLDLADVPALIAGFGMGPIYGVAIQFVKVLLHLSGSTTGGVGEFSNFVVGSTFVLVSSLYYKRNKNIKNALIGLILGVISMSIVAMLSNYFVVFPLYAKIMIPMETLIEMGKAVNPEVDSLLSMMLICVLPFNLIKGSFNAIATFVLYKRVRKFL